MKARMLCTTTGAVFTAHVVCHEGRQLWYSDEGAYIGVVGGPLSPYRILHVLDERRKE